MQKIPKQIYFDEPMLLTYEQYARTTGQSFAAVVRKTLAAHPPKINQVKKPTLLDFYGAGRLPNQKHYTIKEEKAAFMNALAKAEKEKRYAR